MTTEPEPAGVMVALPVGTLRLLVGSIVLAVLVMLAVLPTQKTPQSNRYTITLSTQSH